MFHLPNRRRIAGLAIVLAVVGGGTAAMASGPSDGGSYRTATAQDQAVDEVLSSVGTIEPTSQASVAFPVSGTVESVAVQVGDQVTVGQTLGRLDLAELTVSYHEAESTLAQAELTLELALAGESVATSGAGTPSGGFGQSATAGANAGLEAAQRAVLDAQRDVDAALADAQAALDVASRVCSDDVAPTTTTSTTEVAAGAATVDLASCQAALVASLDAQQVLAAAQQALASAATELTTLIEQLEVAQEGGTSTPSTTPSVGSAATDGGGTTRSDPSDAGTNTSGEGAAATGQAAGTSSVSPSAEDLIAYQKVVDAAQADLDVADQALQQAAIVAPIAGTVVSVGFDAGDRVEAASATQAILVVGEGGFEVTTMVSVTDLPDVEVGQTATVLPDGSADEVPGQVVRIGVTPDSGSTTSTYLVTIGLDGDTSGLGNGSTASVAIVTASSGDALAVPTSAVTVDGDDATVQQLVDGEAVEVDVEVGAVGQTWTEVVDGLADGDEVVLADLDAPLPGSATDTSAATTDVGGRGADAGGGRPTGGFGGGRPGN